MKTFRYATIGVAATFAATANFAAPTPATAQYYKGKTITMLVGFRSGSGIDINARELVRFMPQHVPGKPRMIVKNRAGGGTAAQNFGYQKAKPDGLTLIYGPWNPVGQITRNRSLKVRYEKVAFIGGGGTTRLTWGNTVTIPKPGDIVKVSKEKMLNYGGNRVTGSIDLLARLGLDVLGANYRVTFGYDQRSSMVAIPQNETQLATASLNNWIALIDPQTKQHKKGGAMYYYPRLDEAGKPIRSAYVKGIPMFFDVYKEITGRDVPPEGEIWNAMKWLLRMGSLSQVLWAPPGTPKAAVDDLRTGFWKAVKTKEYNDLYFAKYGAPLEFADLQSSLKVVNSIEDADPAIREFFKGYLKQGRSFKNIKPKRKGKGGKGK